MKKCIFMQSDSICKMDIGKIYIGIFGDETWTCKLCGATNSCQYSQCSNCGK